MSTSCRPLSTALRCRRHGPQPPIEELRHFPGALVRRIERDKQSRSPLTKIIGTPVQKQMTARNINTVRELVELADIDASARR